MIEMKKVSFKKLSGIIFLTGLVLITSCKKEKDLNRGWLEGTISIGPICPVEKNPPDPACQPTAETYKAYPVSIFSSDGIRKITQLEPSLDGTFTSELNPGKYLIVLETANKYIGGSNLPVVVTIVSREKTQISINIDTGIR
jgi:hypothetical protein